MKVLLLHQYFWPDMGGSAARLTELAIELKKRGVNIEVIAGPASYSENIPAPIFEVHEGVLIHRLGKLRLDRKSTHGRILKAVRFFALAFLKVIGSDKNSVLFIGSDPPFLPLIGWFMKKIRGQKYVIQVADLYPEIAVQLGVFKKGRVAERILHWINKISFNNSDKVITLSEDMKQQVMKSGSMNGKSDVLVIHNWENEDKILPIAKENNPFTKKYNLTRKIVVLYSGNMGLAHDLTGMIDAADALQDNQNLFFLFIGGGAQKERLEALAQERKLINTMFLPYQPYEQLPYTLTSGDIAIVSMKPGTEGLCVPSKLYAALAAGSAIIGIVPEGTEISRVIKEYNCGVRVSPEKSEELVETIKHLARTSSLLSTYQKNARDCFEKFFTKRRAAEEYLNCLTQFKT